MNLSPRTVSRIINEDLGLRAFKRRTGHLITPALRDIRRVRSKMLLTRHDDSAPAHKAKSTQQWLETNVPEFIKANEWPSGSFDLNPFDYSLWAYLEEKVCSKRYHNLDQLKSALVRAMKEIPLEKAISLRLDKSSDVLDLFPELCHNVHACRWHGCDLQRRSALQIPSSVLSSDIIQSTERCGRSLQRLEKRPKFDRKESSIMTMPQPTQLQNEEFLFKKSDSVALTLTIQP
ncbi:hypothetical protein LAZ67_6003943 [Cordylochernes scorpioides]|uniref:Transposase n=1 Tax=Cordylochernes scorpioides TaxID=51811 RepID=A0ABY6KLN0_9ARAC|nr:hypothetical protein LAZ67_6003943 [Cordylochernes scorpioides]